jgi:hypothetical protein
LQLLGALGFHDTPRFELATWLDTTGGMVLELEPLFPKHA